MCSVSEPINRLIVVHWISLPCCRKYIASAASNYLCRDLNWKMQGVLNAPLPKLQMKRGIGLFILTPTRNGTTIQTRRLIPLYSSGGLVLNKKEAVMEQPLFY